MEIGHVNGYEEDSSRANLFWTCRSCNIRSANALRAAGIGRLTNQYNPRSRAGSPTPDEYLIARARAGAGARIHGIEQLIGAYRMYAHVLRRKPGDVAAKEGFYRMETALRRQARRNPSGGAKSLGQWLTAVSAMKGESRAMPVADAVEMIRATPPEHRSEFAQEIWRKRRQHFGPTGRSDSVPF